MHSCTCKRRGHRICSPLKQVHSTMLFLLLLSLTLQLIQATASYDYGFAKVTGINFGDNEKVNFTLQVDTNHFQISDTDVLNPSSVFTNTDMAYFESVMEVLGTAYEKESFNGTDFLMQLADPMTTEFANYVHGIAVLIHPYAGFLSECVSSVYKKGTMSPKSYYESKETNECCVSWLRDFEVNVPFYSNAGVSCNWHCFNQNSAKGSCETNRENAGLHRTDYADVCYLNMPYANEV